MSANFASSLRVAGDAIAVGAVGTPGVVNAPGATGALGDDVLSIRVQMPEVWDAIGVSVARDTPVAVVKESALRELYNKTVSPSEFVLKFNGFEILDEGRSLAQLGIRNGSTILMTWRRRRPVR